MTRLLFRILPFLLIVGSSLLLTGCLKTKIITNQPTSAQEAELPWAHGFVNGLVPPVNAPLNAQPTCGTSGVAQVYFRMPFTHWLASGLTTSLYTPQKFTATCASGTAAADTPSDAKPRHEAASLGQ